CGQRLPLRRALLHLLRQRLRLARYQLRFSRKTRRRGPALERSAPAPTSTMTFSLVSLLLGKGVGEARRQAVKRRLVVVKCSECIDARLTRIRERALCFEHVEIRERAAIVAVLCKLKCALGLRDDLVFGRGDRCSIGCDRALKR